MVSPGEILGLIQVVISFGNEVDLFRQQVVQLPVHRDQRGIVIHHVETVVYHVEAVIIHHIKIHAVVLGIAHLGVVAHFAAQVAAQTHKGVVFVMGIGVLPDGGIHKGVFLAQRAEAVLYQASVNPGVGNDHVLINVVMHIELRVKVKAGFGLELIQRSGKSQVGMPFFAIGLKRRVQAHDQVVNGIVGLLVVVKIGKEVNVQLLLVH